MTIKAHFDGRTIVPDEPVAFSKGERLEVDVRRILEPAKPITGTELAGSKLFGLWADRTEIQDSTEFSRSLRRDIERRLK